MSSYNESELIAGLRRSAAAVGGAQLRQLETIAACDRAGVWRHGDFRDLTQWVALELGVPHYRAGRMVHAARAIESLPGIGAALGAGVMSLDKVLELCRFATAAAEDELISWACRVSVGAIRNRADEAVRIAPDELKAAERARYLDWSFDSDNLCMWLEGRLPAADGHRVAGVLDSIARDLPRSPEDDDGCSDGLEARRADALVELAEGSSRGKGRRDTVVVHAPLDALLADAANPRIENGPVIAPEIARRMMCDARIDIVLYDGERRCVGIGRASRRASERLERQVRHRDGWRCTFPGCGARHYLRTHHIAFWDEDLGPTDLDNLITVCPYHHKLVHEFGWRVYLRGGVEPEWYRPDGTRYRSGPAPPRDFLTLTA